MSDSPEFLTVHGRRIAVRRQAGAEPAIIWLGGFKSDMESGKAGALVHWGASAGRAVVRFDYSGHGASEGNFKDLTITDWLDDAMQVIARFAGRRPILVGSSMGAWIAILAARLLKSQAAEQRPSALVLIAPAVDFTERLMWDVFSPEIRAEIEESGVWYRPSAYAAEPTPVTRALIEDGRRHLLLGRSFEIGCPAHILQGMQDPDVPWRHALSLVEHLPHDVVTLMLINDGDHRLSREEDIARLIRTVSEIED
jgi:pimeloyl-ACP methyl ester carboxylesterase